MLYNIGHAFYYAIITYLPLANLGTFLSITPFFIDIMAVVGGRVAIAATNDGVAVIKKELIVDPESGLILEAENIKVAVDVGDGNIVVREQQRIKGVHVPTSV